MRPSSNHRHLVVVDRDGYEVYDEGQDDCCVQGRPEDRFGVDLVGRDSMTDAAHFATLVAAIQKGEKLKQPVAQGNVAVTLLQLSNIAWETQRELHLNNRDGKVLSDPEAMKFWDRTYEDGWAPHL